MYTHTLTHTHIDVSACFECCLPNNKAGPALSALGREYILKFSAAYCSIFGMKHANESAYSESMIMYLSVGVVESSLSETMIVEMRMTHSSRNDSLVRLNEISDVVDDDGFNDLVGIADIYTKKNRFDNILNSRNVYQNV